MTKATKLCKHKQQNITMITNDNSPTKITLLESISNKNNNRFPFISNIYTNKIYNEIFINYFTPEHLHRNICTGTSTPEHPHRNIHTGTSTPEHPHRNIHTETSTPDTQLHENNIIKS